MSAKLRKPFRPTDLDREKRDDGGPASAMTLRDYFAGQVLASQVDEATPGELAALCYEVADALIKERAKP